MRKKKNHIPKMKGGRPKETPYTPHIRLVGIMARTWGGCDKQSSVESFGGGGS